MSAIELKLHNGSLLVKDGHLCTTCCCPEWPVKVYMSGGLSCGSGSYNGGTVVGPYSRVEGVAFDARGILVFSAHDNVNSGSDPLTYPGCGLQLQGSFTGAGDGSTITVSFGDASVSVTVADLACDTTCQGGGWYCSCVGTP